jgi:hypothetical protein
MDSPQERKAVVWFIDKFDCELCAFAVKMVFMDEHQEFVGSESSGKRGDPGVRNRERLLDILARQDG